MLPTSECLVPSLGVAGQGIAVPVQVCEKLARSLPDRGFWPGVSRAGRMRPGSWEYPADTMGAGSTKHSHRAAHEAWQGPPQLCLTFLRCSAPACCRTWEQTKKTSQHSWDDVSTLLGGLWDRVPAPYAALLAFAYAFYRAACTPRQSSALHSGSRQCSHHRRVSAMVQRNTSTFVQPSCLCAGQACRLGPVGRHRFVAPPHPASHQGDTATLLLTHTSRGRGAVPLGATGPPQRFVVGGTLCRPLMA